MRIRTIDFESTGDSPDGDKHGLVEIGFVDVVSTSSDLLGAPVDWIVETPGWDQSRLCNPGVPIPPETAAIHHIIDADVADARPWKRVLRALLKQSVADGVEYFAAHGAKMEELWFHRDWWFDVEHDPIPFIDTFKCALRLWPDAPLHSNMGLRYHRMPEGLIRELGLPAHRALPDAYVTAFHVRDMLNEGAEIKKLLEWSTLPALTVRCYIGDYRNGGKGTPWPEVETSMLHWILGKDFPEDTVFTVRHHLQLREQAAAEEAQTDDLNEQLRANGLPVDGEPDPAQGAMVL